MCDGSDTASIDAGIAAAIHNGQPVRDRKSAGRGPMMITIKPTATRASIAIGNLINRANGKKYHQPVVRTSPSKKLQCPSELWCAMNLTPLNKSGNGTANGIPGTWPIEKKYPAQTT